MERKIRSKIEGMCGPEKLPGVTVAVALPGGETVRAAAGLADLETGETMGLGARMFSGSVGKMFVASLVLGLEAEGALALHEPISAHLGGERWFERLPNARAIEIRHLLSHTSGVSDHTALPEFWAAVRAAPDRPWSVEDRVGFILDGEPLFPPGELFHYSDTNYILLGALVERLEGRSWYAAAKTRLFGPCGLEDTAPAVGRHHGSLPAGYGERLLELGLSGKVASGGRYFFDPAVEGAGGGLVTTSADLVRFARSLFGGRVLPASAVSRMTARAFSETGLPDGAGYGLGAILWETPDGPSFGHSGFVPGYNTLVEYFADRDLAVALQTNTDASTARLGRTLHAAAVEIVREFV